MTPSNHLVQALRRTLKSRGITYAQLAKLVGVSEPTIKRGLGYGNLSLRRLDAICAALEIGVADLLHGREGEASVTQLTDEQERALASNPRLLVVAYLLLNNWSPQEITASFQLDRNQLVNVLLDLDRLRIIEFRPPSRVKRLLGHNFTWRKDGPVHAFFLSRLAPEFFDAAFDTPGDEFCFVCGTVTAASRAQMQLAVRKLAEQFDLLARADSQVKLSERTGCAAVLAIRSFEFSDFARLRRKS